MVEIIGGEIMFYRVESVEPKDNFILSVSFTDGVKLEYDIKNRAEKAK